jgi:hypothetical protein
MSTRHGLLQGFAAWFAHALSVEGRSWGQDAGEEKAVEPTVGRAAPWWPPEIERGAGDIDEKELQIRILMATWM